jgi:hypothetical protein
VAVQHAERFCENDGGACPQDETNAYIKGGKIKNKTHKQQKDRSPPRSPLLFHINSPTTAQHATPTTII